MDRTQLTEDEKHMIEDCKNEIRSLIEALLSNGVRGINIEIELLHFIKKTLREQD